MKVRGNSLPRLSLRGKHRGERLEARKRAHKAYEKARMPGFESAYHVPGSSKK